MKKSGSYFVGQTTSKKTPSNLNLYRTSCTLFEKRSPTPPTQTRGQGQPQLQRQLQTFTQNQPRQIQAALNPNTVYAHRNANRTQLNLSRKYQDAQTIKDIQQLLRNHFRIKPLLWKLDDYPVSAVHGFSSSAPSLLLGRIQQALRLASVQFSFDSDAACYNCLKMVDSLPCAFSISVSSLRKSCQSRVGDKYLVEVLRDLPRTVDPRTWKQLITPIFQSLKDVIHQSKHATVVEYVHDDVLERQESIFHEDYCLGSARSQTRVAPNPKTVAAKANTFWATQEELIESTCSLLLSMMECDWMQGIEQSEIERLMLELVDYLLREGDDMSVVHAKCQALKTIVSLGKYREPSNEVKEYLQIALCANLDSNNSELSEWVNNAAILYKV